MGSAGKGGRNRRLADGHALAVLLGGLGLNLVFLTGLARFAHVSAGAVVCMLGIGLVGVTVTPRWAFGCSGPATSGRWSTRSTARSSPAGSSSAPASAARDRRVRLRAPLWLGTVLALLGILALVPDLVRRAAPQERQRQVVA
jgi:hypothetical protein